MLVSGRFAPAAGVPGNMLSASLQPLHIWWGARCRINFARCQCVWDDHPTSRLCVIPSPDVQPQRAAIEIAPALTQHLAAHAPWVTARWFDDTLRPARSGSFSAGSYAFERVIYDVSPSGTTGSVVFRAPRLTGHLH